jgi:hypothetical protein
MRGGVAIGLLVAAAGVLAALAAGAFAVGSELAGGARADGVPSRVASELLAAGDDLELRRALLLTGDGRSIESTLRRHAEATARLAALAADARPSLGSRAANEIGLLQLRDMQTDRQRAAQRVAAAKAAFEVAVRADPSNEEAKYNLELILALTQQQSKRKQSSSTKKGTKKRRAGFSPGGSGY